MKRIVDIKLTGVAGSGKTTIINAITPIIKTLGAEVILNSPNSTKKGKEQLAKRCPSDYVVFISEDYHK